MKYKKKKRIPFEYRRDPDPERQIRTHYRAFFTLAAGGLMPHLEPDDLDKISER